MADLLTATIIVDKPTPKDPQPPSPTITIGVVVGRIIALTIMAYAVYLSWTCNSKVAGMSIFEKLFRAIFAGLFGTLYLIIYFIFWRTECMKNGMNFRFRHY